MFPEKRNPLKLKHNKAFKWDSCRVAFLVCIEFCGDSGLRKVGLGGTHPLTQRYDSSLNFLSKSRISICNVFIMWFVLNKELHMARNRYWVVWTNAIEQWQVKKTGNETALKNFNVKADAIDYGVDIAKRNIPSQLTIKKKDGQIEDERTYGNDPYPPKG
ncbi:DUF2188 domain-containing protein [Vibrio vulnificus]|nr:DUF2188 domain-containing protein [Vibrio vulnificus]